tara:strand:- start:98 stop:433 length:336 start_codon:yes stop_codon:yes gene_type:complete
MEKYDTEMRKAQCKEKNLDPKTWHGKTVKNGQFHFATVDRTTTWRSARRKLAIKLGVPEVNPVTQSFQVEFSNDPEDVMNTRPLFSTPPLYFECDCGAGYITCTSCALKDL